MLQPKIVVVNNPGSTQIFPTVETEPKGHSNMSRRRKNSLNRNPVMPIAEEDQIDVVESNGVNCREEEAKSNKPTIQSETISTQPLVQNVNCLISHMQRNWFGIQVSLVLLILCIPGNVVTLYLYQHSNVTLSIEDEDAPRNQSELSCHELKEDWSKLVSHSRFLVQGVSCTVIGIFGFCANVLSIFVLIQCRDNKNFHRLLAGLAIVDILLLTDLVFEMSIVGVFMKREPLWFIHAYPHFIHPARGIIQTMAIFMIVAVTTERYRAMCHPMLRRQAYYKYIVVVLGLSACLEFPRFFEIRLNKDKSQYWTTDLMENPYYVRFNSYWNELFATGLAPLISLCYMNLRIFLRIKASSRYALRFVSTRVPIIKSNANNISRVTPPREDVNDTDEMTALQRSSSADSNRQAVKSGAYYVKRRQEKSTAILVAIILIFLVCHVHRLVYRIYEIALPDKSVYEHYIHCDRKGRYHVPVAIYFLSHSNHLFLAISSSANFIIYCCMGRQFRQQLTKMVLRLWAKIRHR